MTRLAVLMKDRQLESLGELDAAAPAIRHHRSISKSTAFGEHQLGMEAVSKAHRLTKPEVTHQEMLDYYQEHAADYAVPAKAKFEILTVKFANFPQPARGVANAIAQMGNEVYSGRHALCGRGQQALAGAERRQWRLLRLGQPGQPGLQSDRPGHLYARDREAQPDHRRRDRLSHHPRDGAAGRRARSLSSKPSRRSRKPSKSRNAAPSRRNSRRAANADRGLDDLRPACRQIAAGAARQQTCAQR